MTEKSRREFAAGLAAAGMAAGAAVAATPSAAAEPQGPVWDVRSLGAAGDGSRLDTKPIQAAIDSCSRAGGGTVLLRAGRYLSGTLRLRSRVTLHLAEGCTLAGSADLADYPVTVASFRSYTDNYTDKSLIYGEDVESVAIVGRGALDGQGASFQGPYKLRPYMLRLIRSRDILVRDVTFRDSPMWVQHYLACDDVRIEGIRVRSLANQNNDGIDIDGCHRVRIAACDIQSGDDAVVLKSTSDRLSRDVLIGQCILSSRCNALKLGTETNGGFENIVIQGCTLYDTRLSGIALECVDGGRLDRVVVSDIVMRDVQCPLFIRLGDRARPFVEGGARPGVGSLRDVLIRGVLATGAGSTGCAIAGLPGHPAERITLREIDIAGAGGGTHEQAQRTIPEEPSKYPEHSMFGILPAHGFYCRHVRGLRIEGVRLAPVAPDFRPAVICDDVENLEIQGLRATVAPQGEPMLSLIDVRDPWIQGCRPI